MAEKHFEYLPRLERLDLSDNPYVFVDSVEFMSSLKRTVIVSLYLNNTGIGHANPDIQEHIFRSVRELHLKHLTLDNNRIDAVDRYFF